LSTVKVVLFVVFTFSLAGGRRLGATATKPFLPTSRRPVSLNLSSGLLQVSVIWTVFVAAPIVTLCALLWPWPRVSMNWRGLAGERGADAVHH
jgi:hypothetical protein